MKTKIFLALLGLVLGLAPQIALADTWTFDANAPGGHGFYNGTGGVDGHFTTSTTDYGSGKTISLSLRGATRFVGPIAPINSNDYLCAEGQACNFDFSVSTTGWSIKNFDYNLIIDDLTTGLNMHFDPRLIWDNSYWTTHKTWPYNSAATGFQNSEFFGSGIIQSHLSYSAGDQMLVTLSASPKDATLTDPWVSIGFNTTSPVPEPSAIVLTFTVVGFLGFKHLRRRRQQQS